MTDSSTQGIKTLMHPVSDLAAKAVYTALLGLCIATTETDGGASCALDDEASADIAQNDGRYTARYEGTARPARYQGAAGPASDRTTVTCAVVAAGS